MCERSDRELNQVFQDAYLRRSEQGNPDTTYVSDCATAARRALYDLGRADASAEFEAMRADRDRLTERVARCERVAAELAKRATPATDHAKGYYQARYEAADMLRAALASAERSEAQQGGSLQVARVLDGVQRETFARASGEALPEVGQWQPGARQYAREVPSFTESKARVLDTHAELLERLTDGTGEEQWEPVDCAECAGAGEIVPGATCAACSGTGRAYGGEE